MFLQRGAAISFIVYIGVLALVYLVYYIIYTPTYEQHFPFHTASFILIHIFYFNSMLDYQKNNVKNKSSSLIFEMRIFELLVVTILGCALPVSTNRIKGKMYFYSFLQCS